MAKTIITTTTITFGSKSVVQNGSITSTGDDYVDQTGTATVTGTVLQIGDVGTEGNLQIKNTGDTNNLLISLDGGTTYPIVIKPGITNLISVGTLGTIFQKSSAATTTFEYFLTEE
jgi:hypothetical protein